VGEVAEGATKYFELVSGWRCPAKLGINTTAHKRYFLNAKGGGEVAKNYSDIRGVAKRGKISLSALTNI